MLNEIEKSLVYDDGLLMYYAESNGFNQNDKFDSVLRKIIKLHAALEGVSESAIYESINIENLKKETERALKAWLFNESDLMADEMLEHFSSALHYIYHDNVSRKNKGIELFANFLKTFKRTS